MKHSCIVIIYLLLLLPTLQLTAQNQINTDLIEQENNNKPAKAKPTVLPIAFYSPETKLAIGATGLLLFKTSDSITRTSFIDFFGLKTQRNQKIYASFWSIFTPRERFFIKGEIYFSKFPDYFYGIGNTSPEISREDIRYKTFFSYNWILKQVKPHFFIGPQYQVYKVFDTHFPLHSIYNKGNLGGFNGSFTSGAGLAVVYDTRDHSTNAHMGWYIEASSYFYAKPIGSQYNFSSFILDIRKYIPLNATSTLALALTNSINIGEVPFKQLAFLGGTRNMRGYYEGRYRDNNSIVLQAEYRKKVYKRWGFVVFGSVGKVYKKAQDILQSPLHYTVGTGIRFTINRKENTNLRIDEGVGKLTHGFYGNFGEAF